MNEGNKKLRKKRREEGSWREERKERTKVRNERERE